MPSNSLDSLRSLIRKLLVEKQTLTAWPFSLPLSLALWISKWGSASANERCLLTGGLKCRVLVEKLPGPQFGIRLREVSVSGGSTVSYLRFICAREERLNFWKKEFPVVIPHTMPYLQTVSQNAVRMFHNQIFGSFPVLCKLLLLLFFFYPDGLFQITNILFKRGWEDQDCENDV